ncbi:MAG: fumarylacetoacetate hydrolase family protein [Nitrospina sp.]|nr:fumarylacetoacetate hydrolase family protein [Nitrospina sp.]MBT6716764.1 fumarylacetoacetate hydrolase family protein [Nitrospina sp.]
MSFSSHKFPYKPNRIFCIGKNYGEHIKELGDNQTPKEPVVFMKPICNIVAPGESLNYPSYGNDLHHEVEVVLLIGKEGKNIPETDALTHISDITLGLDLTLRDVQKTLKSSGLPWERSKSFEQSAPLGIFKKYNSEKIDLTHLPFSCSVNGKLRQKGNTAEMIFPVASLIHILSGWWTLRPGDIIFTGTPAGVAALHPGDKIEVESPKIGAFSWRLV